MRGFSLSAGSLAEVASSLRGENQLSAGKCDLKLGSASNCAVDFRDIRGQAAVKRALEVAAAGNHNIMLVGPPGTGALCN